MILVTGGLGFVGSNLVDILVEDENDVVVIDDLSSESASLDNKTQKPFILLIRLKISIKYYKVISLIKYST